MSILDNWVKMSACLEEIFIISNSNTFKAETSLQLSLNQIKSRLNSSSCFLSYLTQLSLHLNETIHSFIHSFNRHLSRVITLFLGNFDKECDTYHRKPLPQPLNSRHGKQKIMFSTLKKKSKSNSQRTTPHKVNILAHAVMVGA